MEEFQKHVKMAKAAGLTTEDLMAAVNNTIGISSDTLIKYLNAGEVDRVKNFIISASEDELSCQAELFFKLATYTRFHDLLRLFLSRYDVNCKFNSSQCGYTPAYPIFLAIRSENFSALEIVLEQSNVDVNMSVRSIRGDGYTPLLYYVYHTSKLEMLKVLLSHSNINVDSIVLEAVLTLAHVDDFTILLNHPRVHTRHVHNSSYFNLYKQLSPIEYALPIDTLLLFYEKDIVQSLERDDLYPSFSKLPRDVCVLIGHYRFLMDEAPRISEIMKNIMVYQVFGRRLGVPYKAWLFLPFLQNFCGPDGLCIHDDRLSRSPEVYAKAKSIAHRFLMGVLRIGGGRYREGMIPQIEREWKIRNVAEKWNAFYSSYSALYDFNVLNSLETVGKRIRLDLTRQERACYLLE